MKVIKKFTAVKLNIVEINDEVKADLSYGTIDGPYYSRSRPEQEFDTEDEAIEYAYKTEPYGRWLIAPIIRFDN